MNKKRLIIFPGNFLPHIGGLETHVDEFVKYLSKSYDYEITIFVPNTVYAKDYEIIHKGVKVIRYPAFEIVYNFPFPKFWSFKFWRMFIGLYSKDFDIVMTRTRFFTNSTLGMFFAKFRFKRLKLVHVEHGSDFIKLNSKIKSFISLIYDKILGKLLFFLADKNIAISEASYEFVKLKFAQYEDVPIIKRGVDFNLYENIEANIKIREEYFGKIIIGSLCRLYKWKGIENSIKAFISLPKDIKEKCIYLVVGDGEDFVRLKKLAQNEDNIVFLGEVNFNEAISLLKSFDIFIHSSYKGGALSNSLLQALYCKCGVVASPYEGADEVVFDGKTGLLLKDNSVLELEKGMIKLIEDKNLREKLGKNGKRYIEDNFDWERVVEKYEKVFEEVLKK